MDVQVEGGDHEKTRVCTDGGGDARKYRWMDGSTEGTAGWTGGIL